MQIIIDYLKDNPVFKISALEKEMGIPKNILANALSDKVDKGVPQKHLFKIVAVLSKYGFRPNGWYLMPDENTATFVAERRRNDQQESIEVEEKNEEGIATSCYFYYKYEMDKQLITDLLDLKDILKKV